MRSTILLNRRKKALARWPRQARKMDEMRASYKRRTRLVDVQCPPVDRALCLLVQSQVAVDMVRQAHGQTFDEWQEAHDPPCLLIVELKPAPPFRVQSVPVEGLMQQLHTCMYTRHTHIYI